MSDTNMKMKEIIVKNINYLNKNYIATSEGLIPITKKELKLLRLRKSLWGDSRMSDTLKAVHMKFDWLFVRPIEEVVGGKIIIPDSAKEVTQKGEIVAMPEKCSDLNLKLHDEILFRRRAAFKVIEIDGVRLNVMKPADVLAVMFGDEVTAVTPTKENVFLEWEFKTAFYPGTNLVIPGTHQERHYTGIVVAIGPDVKDIVIGDRVFFDQFASAGVEKFQEDGKRYAFLKAGDIYCSNVPLRKEVVAEVAA